MRISGYPLALVLLLTTLTACGSGSSSSSSTWPTSSQYVSAAYIQSVAFRNHTAMAWGNNGYGQLGNGNSGNSLIPVAVTGLPRVDSIVTGGTHSLAFRNLSGVWAWGNNGYGQLGNMTVTATQTPVRVFANISSTASHVRAYLGNVTAVAAGGNHSLALDSLQNVWAWGANNWGQAGGDPSVLSYSTDARVIVHRTPTGPGWTPTQIAAGGGYSLALDADGSVWAWGNNDSAQLGHRTDAATYSPARVFQNYSAGTTLSSVTAVAAGGSHSLALLATGKVVAWGYNYYGQLGSRSAGTFSSRPVTVVDAGGTDLSNIIAISAGLDHSLALRGDRTVWAWGYNASGQLGNGSIVNSPVAVQVTGLSSIERILAIGHHSLAFAGPSAWAWGDNAYGQLGVNSTANLLAPALVTGFR